VRVCIFFFSFFSLQTLFLLVTPKCELVGVAQTGLNQAWERYKKVEKSPIYKVSTFVFGAKPRAVRAAEAEVKQKQAFLDACVGHCKTLQRGNSRNL
jgi:hypothetical protein